MLDLKIINGKILDTLQNCITENDIGIKDGKIIEVGRVVGDAKKVIDAKGQYVSPGFIDIHMHEEDLALTKRTDLDISKALLNNGVTTAVGGNCGANRNNFYEFISYIETEGYPINFMTYVGHNYLRDLVGNKDPYKKSTKLQMSQMKSMLSDYIEFGAIGLSYGLEYCPGIDEEETINLCEDLVGRKDLLISIHARKDAKKAKEAMEEIERLAHAVQIPMQISHLSSFYAYGNMEEGLSIIEKMREEGLDIQGDAYPYGAFSCKIGSTVFDEGCFENWNKSYDSIMLAEGEYKGQICDKELFYKIRKEHPLMYVVAMVMNEEEIKTALKKPYMMIASDGGYNNHQGHPRGAGTFTRVLGKYCKEEQVIDLLDAIYKMTMMPAKRLHLSHRKGAIKEGYDADLVIFDEKEIMDGATFMEPQGKPKGIDFVIVNGIVALEKGIEKNLQGGKFIKRQPILETMQ